MSHLPVNHHLQPLYRTLAAASGLYMIVFGIVGWTQTSDYDLFAQDGLPTVLGLRSNLAFSVLSVVAGIVLVAGAFVGRGIDRWINLVGGIAFMITGMTMLALMETDLNFLGFTMATCIVSLVIGLILFSAGLYGRSGSRGQHVREERFRHNAAVDPEAHPWNSTEAKRANGTA